MTNAGIFNSDQNFVIQWISDLTCLTHAKFRVNVRSCQWFKPELYLTWDLHYL